jgi:hypothetical protein
MSGAPIGFVGTWVSADHRAPGISLEIASADGLFTVTRRHASGVPFGNAVSAAPEGAALICRDLGDDEAGTLTFTLDPGAPRLLLAMPDLETPLVFVRA